MVTYINIDTILSDPLLITATALLIIGPILFLISFWKLIRSSKKKDPLFDPGEIHDEPIVADEKTPQPVAPVTSPPPPPTPKPMPSMTRGSLLPDDMEKTVVMPAGVAEIQGQLEIAFSQIKHLNKKVYELETMLNAVSPNTSSPQQNTLLEMPTNANDFAQKLLKLAEHVIVLEKNMSRVIAKTGTQDTALPHSEPTTPAAAGAKPPIMPL